MDIFVNNICRSASFALYRIGQIRKFLDQKSTEMPVHAFITCRLDQCNSLLYGLPESQITNLQRIQNSAARLVTLSQKNMTMLLQFSVNCIGFLSSIVLCIKFYFLYTNVSLILHQFIFKNLSRNINPLAISFFYTIASYMLRQPSMVEAPSLW